jgi:excinuclease ABC subunit A
VVVVEHDRDIIQAADYIIDIGPMAGRLGGELVFSGNYSKLLKHKESITAKYLNGTLKIEIPKTRRISRKFIQISGAREHNLKQLTVRFPLNVMTVVTGVSGSGKTTLVKNILYPALQKQLQGQSEIKPGRYSELSGDLNAIHEVAMVDQNPIGRSSRSNPATYLKAFDDIRQLFADEPLAKIRGYKPGFFSFNVEGGRCEHCEGEGYIAVSMQFMADVKLLCKECKGKRYKDEVLDVKVNGMNISEILDMTVLQAIDFFVILSNRKIATSIVKKLKPLQQVGLGYLKLGQSSSTLSGGEAQRIKLAYFLALGASQKPTLFIFDEPTTGLHFHDIHLLYESFNRLIENGHSMIIIEHNPDMIKCADWIIDLGKEGGDAGGHLIFEGTPEDLIKNKNGYTAQYITLN